MTLFFQNKLDLDQRRSIKNPTQRRTGNPTLRSSTILRISSAASDRTETKTTKGYGYGYRKRKILRLLSGTSGIVCQENKTK